MVSIEGYNLSAVITFLMTFEPKVFHHSDSLKNVCYNYITNNSNIEVAAQVLGLKVKCYKTSFKKFTCIVTRSHLPHSSVEYRTVIADFQKSQIFRNLKWL